MAKKDKLVSTMKVEDGSLTSIAITNELMKKKKVDLSDPKKVMERIDWYFNLMAQYNSRPLVAGLAQALGMDRRRLREIVNRIDGQAQLYHSVKQNITEESRQIIIDAYNSLETAWEYNFVNNKMNPIAGIFVAKNNYGYQDKTETVVQVRNPLGEIEDREKMEQRFLESVISDK